MDEERSDVSLRAASEAYPPGFRRSLLERSESPKNMFKDGFNSAPSPKDTVWRRRYGLFSIFLFRIGLQIGPDAGKNAKQADDVV